MKTEKFQAPCVPLITNDPMFNVWSFADKLTDDVPRHWTGARQFITGTIAIDGVLFQFIGKLQPDNSRYMTEFPALPQTDLTIRPMTTVYTFENETIRLRLQFMSPLLPDDLMLLSRPITYLSYHLEAKDAKPHQIHLFLGFSCELAVDHATQSVSFDETAYSICCSSGTENMLRRSGDDHRIEWGSFHLIAPHWSKVALPAQKLCSRIHSLYADKMEPTNPVNYQGPAAAIPRLNITEIMNQRRSTPIIPCCWPKAGLN